MKRLIPFLVLIAAAAVPFFSFGSEKGIQVKTRSGEILPPYENSYALIVGVSDYTAGWPKLPNVSKELDPVEEVLKSQGFEVVRKDNLNGEELKTAFSHFIDEHGYDKRNRLLFFFSGHGHTMGDGSKGYLVPKDAPDPRSDEKGFLRKALSMDQILAWSRDLSATHALFLFDSCFSGTIFKAKDLPEAPPDISKMTALPVRQYLTAGDAGEAVPAKSAFTPAFVDALRYGLGDLDRDGYISGTELGVFLRKEVPKHERQTPQFGKIRDYELSRGDFVFLAGGSAAITRPEPPRSSEPLTGSLLVETRPPGAVVYVNEGRVDASPVKLPGLSPGKVEVRASLRGHKDGKETVWVQAGKETKVTLLLDPIHTTGSLQVTSDPSGARWYLDGAYVGATPGDMSNVAAGSHKVTVKIDRYRDWEKTVTVNAGGRETVAAELTPVRKEAASGETWTEPATGMEFVRVSGDCYRMGQTDAEKRYLIKEVGEEKYKEWYSHELPRHEVCVDGFWMAKHEVTVDQFGKFVDAAGYKTEAERDGGCYAYEGEWKKKEGTSWRNPPTVQQQTNHAVVCVSWNDAKAFAKWLSRESGKDIRLPGEAEWEYAARAGTSTIWFWGDDPDRACRYVNAVDTAFKKTWDSSYYFDCDDRYVTTAPVGTYKSNPFGLYDMLGNVWEWCEDWYSSDAYSKYTRDNPIVDTGGSDRVIRGAGWSDDPRHVRCAVRSYSTPGFGSNYLGFRLLRTD